MRIGMPRLLRYAIWEMTQLLYVVIRKLVMIHKEILVLETMDTPLMVELSFSRSMYS
jgi:hypothetical protein